MIAEKIEISSSGSSSIRRRVGYVEQIARRRVSAMRGGLPSGSCGLTSEDWPERGGNRLSLANAPDSDETSLPGGLLVDFLLRNGAGGKGHLVSSTLAQELGTKSMVDCFLGRQPTIRKSFISFSERFLAERSGSVMIDMVLEYRLSIAERLLGLFPPWQGMEDAVKVINFEQLCCRVGEDVSKFRKVIGAEHRDWAVSKSAFLRQASEIVKFERQAKCLKSHVEQYRFTQKVVHCRPRDVQTAEERYARNQHVWSQLHEGGRKVEVPATRSPFKDNLRRQLWGEEDPDDLGLCPRSAAKIARCLTNVQQPVLTGNGDMRKEKPIVRDLDWKHRSCRSNTSVGTWDWARGASGFEHSVSSNKDSFSNHWSNRLFDMVDDDEMQDHIHDKEEMSNEGNATFLSQKIRSASTETMQHTDSRSKSASLPSLRRVRTSTALQNHVHYAKQAVLSKPGSRHERITSQMKLPVASALSVPWQNRSPKPVLTCEDSPTKQYLRACLQSQTIVQPLNFITGHSLRLNAGGRVLSDQDLLNITVALDEVSLTEIDLAENTSLTEKSLLRFVKALFDTPSSESLDRLSFNRCLHASQPAVLNCIIDLVGSPTGVRNLRYLDLSHVMMGVRCQLPFAKVVGDHKNLSSLILSDTGLGVLQGDDAENFIDDLLGNRSIIDLDLGWNGFSADTFSLIGKRHLEKQKLQKLSLSNCTASAAHQQEATSIGFFLQHLAQDKALRYLDVSLNHIDFRSVLVLEDALMYCKNLTELNIAHNPLGVLGMRSLLRLLCHKNSGLMTLWCHDCEIGKSLDTGEEHQFFKASNPCGRYELELDRPYHRAILRMLYKTSDRFRLSPQEAFSHIVYSRRHSHIAWEHAQKDYWGIDTIANQGKLSVTFSIGAAIQKKLGGIDIYAFGAYLERYSKLMKCAPSMHKQAAFFALWQSLKGLTRQQVVMLEAMAKDFLFTLPQLREMIRCDLQCKDILERLLPCLEGGQRAQFLAFAFEKRLIFFTGTLRKMSSLLYSCVENPNGHYKLCLDQHSDYYLAERLLLLDRWESSLPLKDGHIDVSQRGNRSVIRNEMFRHQAIQAHVINASEWHLPEHGILEFDYSSKRRPPATAVALDDITHSNIMVALQQSACSQADQIKALRTSSNAFWITCKQLRMLFHAFVSEQQYVDLVVLFFTRILDIQNEKLFRIKIDVEVQHMRSRLGPLWSFPFIQPEQSHWRLDLAQSEHRVVAALFMQLAQSEDWNANLKSPEYCTADWTKVPLESHLNPNWSKVEEIPKEGFLSFTYESSPDNRNDSLRKKFLEAYGHWHCPVEKSDIIWWSSLQNVPDDVLAFLDFLISRFCIGPDGISMDGEGVMMRAFKAFDSGQAQWMSVGQFELKLLGPPPLGMGCKIFRGEDEKDEKMRIRNVFRWLDPSQEGEISLEEFMVLQHMFKEVIFTIEEFVGFCVRTYGGDLEVAFSYLDTDDSGEIELDEWQSACSSIGYNGPVNSIFSYCDTDHEGTISLEEFMALQKFQEKLIRQPTSKDSITRYSLARS